MLVRLVHVLGALSLIAPAAARADVKTAASSASSSASAAVEAPEEDALLGDFVELGWISRGASHEGAMLELVNMSELTLDVTVGQGSASLAPHDRLIARVPAGDVAVKAVAKDVDVAALEGTLQVERGKRYQVAFGHGQASAGEEEGGDAATPAGTRVAKPSSPRATPEPVTKRRHVDVGRKKQR